MITNVILILYSSSIKKNLILTHLRFRHNIECFALFSQQISFQFASLGNSCFVPESINRLNDSVQSQ